MENIDIQRDIDHIIKQIKIPELKKELEKYMLVREKIDKVKIRTRRNDAQAILSLDKYLTKNKINYMKVTQDQMLKWEDFLSKELKLNKDSSIPVYEIHVKRFYKYLFNKEDYKRGKRFQRNLQYPNCVSWMSSSNSNGKTLPLERILSYEEIKRMLDTCDNVRDQAMILTFIDTGLRNSELVSLNVENLGFDKLGAYLILPSDKTADLKTGQRKVRYFIVPSAVKYMKEYINKHPYKHYDKAPLFYSKYCGSKYEFLQREKNGGLNKEDFELLRLNRLSVKDIVKKIGKYANVSITRPHDLRHNSCTFSAKLGLNEMELRIRYGWSTTSKMPSRYTHLASKDVDDKIKVIIGFQEPDKPENASLQTIICWNCNEDNVPTNKFCGKCGSNLVRKKEDIVNATELGIGLQKSMDQDELYNMMYKQMNELRKEIRELKNK